MYHVSTDIKPTYKHTLPTMYKFSCMVLHLDIHRRSHNTEVNLGFSGRKWVDLGKNRKFWALHLGELIQPL